MNTWRAGLECVLQCILQCVLECCPPVCPPVCLPVCPPVCPPVFPPSLAPTIIKPSQSYLDSCMSSLPGTSILGKFCFGVFILGGGGRLKPKVKPSVRTPFVTVRPRLTKLFSTAEQARLLSITLSQRSPEPGLDEDSDPFNQS